MKSISNKSIHIFFLFSAGIFLRFFVMSFGNNYDFESYCIVGQIAGSFRNVYAETPRYNYGPVFFCIQGLLYRISQVRPDRWVSIYRVLIVSVLTATDLGIAVFIANKYSLIKAIVFFLNPISIIITGYHNQFDNIAVLLALVSTLFFNENKSFTKKDLAFILFFSLSLITKHILFILPIFILLIKHVSIKKRILYAFTPPVVFLLSFIPFAINNEQALQGIINNVFLYRSFNNMPLLAIFIQLFGFTVKQYFLLFCLLMCVTAWFTRKMDFETIMVVYLIAMVAFSSAIANQYLAIPMASLCILGILPWKKLYLFFTGIFLSLEYDGLGFIRDINASLPNSYIAKAANFLLRHGYRISAWILFLSLFQFMIQKKIFANKQRK